MTTLSDGELLRLLQTGESHRVEFKESLSGGVANAVREAACAFANDLPGDGLPGVAFVGVRDDGSPTGAPVTDELLRQLADVKTDGNIVPPPSLFVEKRTLEGEEVAVMTVLPSDSPPVRYKGRIHVRTGSRRGLATEQDERTLNERRRHGNRPFDISPALPSTLSDLNLTFFENDYLTQAFAPDVLAANDRTREQRLASLKMTASLRDPTPTVLGMLVLGKSPEDFVPGAYVQFLKIEGTNWSDPVVDSEDIRGSVSDVLRRLDDKMVSHNRVAVDLTSARTERRESLYPIAALQQITRNAVMHRAYEATNAPVRVTWFTDRVEILNPGGLYGSVNKDNFGAAGQTDYRNPNLADAMRTMGFVQRFGVGITTAQRLLEEAGHPEMNLTPTDSHVLVEIKAAALAEGVSQMTVPVLTFFNNKGGVGKTSLIYHLAWMYAELGFSVLAADLDPQANLTGMFLDEDRMELLWSDNPMRKTVYGALQPLLDRTGDVATPHLEEITPQLKLLAGDLKLSSSEEELSSQWPRCLDRDPGAFRVISSLWRTLQHAAEAALSQIILVDVGPNLGALNRAALIATDYVVVPLGADLYSLQGLRNLGPTLRDWRRGWQERLERNPIHGLPMPAGGMKPIGYVVQQHSVRLNRPVMAYDKWVQRVPKEYRDNLAEPNSSGVSAGGTDDSFSTIKHYRSLLPMSQEASKPIFKLTTADGAFGNRAYAVKDAYADFKALAEEILRRTGIPTSH